MRRTLHHRHLKLALLLAPLLVWSKSAQAKEPGSPHAWSAGTGMQNGYMGVKYQRAIADGHLALGLGFGPGSGFSPSVQWNALRWHSWNLHLVATALYVPGDGIIFSQHSTIAALSPGLQYWAFDTPGTGLYASAGVEVCKQLTGTAEGGREDQFYVFPSLSLGFSI